MMTETVIDLRSPVIPAQRAAGDLVPRGVEIAAEYLERALAAYSERDLNRAELMILAAEMWLRQETSKIC